MDLTDEQWALVKPLLPPPAPALRGRPPSDERRVLNGILWKIRTTNPWYYLPADYPSYQTCYRHYIRWQRIGLMEKIYDVLFQHLEEKSGYDFRELILLGLINMKAYGYRYNVHIKMPLNEDWQISTSQIMIAWFINRLNRRIARARNYYGPILFRIVNEDENDPPLH